MIVSVINGWNMSFDSPCVSPAAQSTISPRGDLLFVLEGGLEGAPGALPSIGSIP